MIGSSLTIIWSPGKGLVVKTRTRGKAAGTSWTGTRTANPTEDVTNIARACGNDELGKEVYDRDNATVKIITPDITVGPFGTIGFWQHQFKVHLFHRGDAQVSEDDLTNYLAYICTNYPDSAALYDRKPKDGEISLQEAYRALNLRRGSMERKAQQQYLATMLNLAANPDDLYNFVDTDFDGIADTVFADAIAQVEGILLGSKSHRRDFEVAKDICDSINNMHE